MNFGPNRNKIIALAVLGVIAAYSIYTNVLSGPDLPPEAKSSGAGGRPSAPIVQGLPEPSGSNAPTQPRRERRQAGRSVGEFRPSLAIDPKNRPDPMRVDPTLRLDLVSRLQNVTVEGGLRSLFDFGSSAAAPTSSGPPIKVPVGAVKTQPGRLRAAMGPEPKPPDPVKPPPPPPPPIPLKFYGLTTPKIGVKRAFFLEGEDIFVASEGDLIKRRYKVVRIGVNSVVLEDTEFKNQQTLPLEEPPANG